MPIVSRFGGGARLILSCVALIPSAAFAEATYGVEASALFDDNVFRFDDRVATDPGSSRSDRLYSLQGDATASFYPADLEVDVNASGGKTWYDKNSGLDNINYNLASSISRSSGTGVDFDVDLSARRSLSSFDDLHSEIKNIQYLEQATPEVRIPIGAETRIVASGQFIESTSSADALKPNDYQVYGGGIGLGWFTPLGNSVTAQIERRYTEGLHQRLLVLGDGSLATTKINDADTIGSLRIVYSLSPITSFLVNASYVSRDDRSGLSGSYSGPEGDITLTYRPRDSLEVKLSGGRHLASTSLLFIDSIKVDFVSAQIKAIIDDKFKLTLKGDYESRHFRYDPTFDVVGDGADRTFTANAGIEYDLIDRVQLAVDAEHSFRDSRLTLSNFTDTNVMLSVRIGLQKNATHSAASRPAN